ncbi:ATP-binding protein [Burkholderia sp. JP2-270]|uniref:ATP-binding protein n=1 Tax=Burkholderia sp. JP2-270 TaxID=2217913 RepID=UPI001EF954F8|nr:ATP-binding protein [Burkholderia sp. JP2-270]
MKISTRLALAGSLATGAVAILFTVLFVTSQQVKKNIENNEVAGNILNAAMALRYLTLEYAQGHEMRTLVQWQSRNASLSRLLSGATGFGGKEELATLDNIRLARRNEESLFAELVNDRRKAGSEDSRDAATQELDARLTGQIMNRMQDMISHALMLFDSSRRGVLDAQQRVNIAVTLFGAVVLLTLLATSILMLRSVIRPLARLRAGAMVVGAGNLDHRLVIVSRDEIGDLCRAFNEMAEALSASMVSRDELELAKEGLQREVSERKRAEERFRLVVEAAPNAMIMVDRDGRIVLVNSQTEKVFGYAREELVGQGIDVLVPERFRPDHPGYRSTFFDDPRSRPMGAGRHLFGMRRDGTEVAVEIGLNPVETSDGVFVLAAIVDITRRKQAEDELRERTEELASSNRDLEQFAYVASHDLQEPLRAIAGPLQLLQWRYRGQLDARADEFIGHAVDGASRMQALIVDLLAFSRVGRPSEPWRLTECMEALDNALKNLAVAIQESGAQITHDGLPTVRAISGQISVLFQNLVGNAIKFRSRERTMQIHVGAKAQDDAWVFHVTDNGIGIESRYFDHIFLIFQRLHTRRDYPGTGIGLALCKRIVEHHGGRIWVESEPGVGTTFFFTLPRRGSPEAKCPCNR